VILSDNICFMSFGRFICKTISVMVYHIFVSFLDLMRLIKQEEYTISKCTSWVSYCFKEQISSRLVPTSLFLTTVFIYVGTISKDFFSFYNVYNTLYVFKMRQEFHTIYRQMYLKAYYLKSTCQAIIRCLK
jgi:hypothetical protein